MQTASIRISIDCEVTAIICKDGVYRGMRLMQMAAMITTTDAIMVAAPRIVYLFIIHEVRLNQTIDTTSEC